MSNGAHDWPAGDASNGQSGHMTDAAIDIVTQPSKEPVHFRHDHPSHDYQQELQNQMSITTPNNVDSSERAKLQMTEMAEADMEEETSSANVISDVVDVGNMNVDDKEKATNDDVPDDTINDTETGESMDTTV